MGVKKERHYSALFRLQTEAATIKSVCKFLKKLNVALTCVSAIPLLGAYPKNSTLYSRDSCSATCFASKFTKAGIWKQLRYLSVEE